MLLLLTDGPPVPVAHQPSESVRAGAWGSGAVAPRNIAGRPDINRLDLCRTYPFGDALAQVRDGLLVLRAARQRGEDGLPVAARLNAPVEEHDGVALPMAPG